MGIDYWDDYTDHLPIEVKFHFYPHVKKRRVSFTDMSARPNANYWPYQAIGGTIAGRKCSDCSYNCKSRRRTTTNVAHPIVDICLKTRLEAVGPVPQRQHRPHLVGHERKTHG